MNNTPVCRLKKLKLKRNYDKWTTTDNKPSYAFSVYFHGPRRHCVISCLLPQTTKRNSFSNIRTTCHANKTKMFQLFAEPNIPAWSSFIYFNSVIVLMVSIHIYIFFLREKTRAKFEYLIRMDMGGRVLLALSANWFKQKTPSLCNR